MLTTIMLVLAYIWASAMTVFIMRSVIRWLLGKVDWVAFSRLLQNRNVEEIINHDKRDLTHLFLKLSRQVID